MRNGERITTGKTSELDDMKFAFYMTGREFKQEFYQPKSISDNPVLEVKNLSLTHAFEDVSFKLKEGEILGITGLLGSGRNELVQTLFGIYSPTKGK
ncbi:ATP-binding cassette domain-containing protein [Bacillus sp. N9]